MQVSKKTLDNLKCQALSDPMKDVPLALIEGIPEPPNIQHNFSSRFALENEPNSIFISVKMAMPQVSTLWQ